MERLIIAYVGLLSVLLLVHLVLRRYIKIIQKNRFQHSITWWQKRALQINSFGKPGSQEDYVEAELRQQRQRLARDLHDSIGSKLTYLVHSLDLMILDISQNGHVTSREQVEELCQFTRETMQILRETVWVMHQPDLTVQQFVDHLRDYLNKYLAIWNHLSHQLHTEGDLSVLLSSEQALNLFRITQEAVTNVLRHAQASSLHIRIISSSHERLRLEILDNGCGFDPAYDRPGIGLDSLRQRTSELGGQLKIDSVYQETQSPKRAGVVRPLPIIPKDPYKWQTAITVDVPFEVENTANAV